MQNALLSSFWRVNMSQLYDQYKKLKEKDSNTLYLFRAGSFYIFLGEDVDRVNEYINLKKTQFCNESLKCGFPVSRLEHYLKIFDYYKLPVSVVDSPVSSKASSSNHLKETESLVINKIRNLSILNMTPIEALEFLKDMQDLLNK